MTVVETFNTGHYLNHGCVNEAEKNHAFLEQSRRAYREGKDGLYPAGYVLEPAEGGPVSKPNVPPASVKTKSVD